MASNLRIAIVGGGLGGTTAGILLQRAGYDVKIYEQAPQIERIGAGIHLQANVMRIMRRLGLHEQLSSIGLAAKSWLSREWDTGRVLFAPDMGDWLVLHRGDLQVALTAALKPETMNFGKRLVDIKERSANTELVFADGSMAEADIVIGADGINSKIREILLGPEAPTYSGFVAYRSVFPAALLNDFKVSADATKWWSDDRHWAQEDRHFIIYYLTRARDEIYFVTGSPDPDWQGGTSPVPADKDEIKACYAGFHPEVQRVIDACPQASKWPLLERKPLPLWSRNNIVLLGDACHPMKPHMGQGAGMAIEDAAMLVRCITLLPDDPVQAFELYRESRIARTTKVQQVSHDNTWLLYPQDTNWVFNYDPFSEPLQPLPQAAIRHE
jgi:6-hydroxynicotinate 3-monooxygenase